MLWLARIVLYSPCILATPLQYPSERSPFDSAERVNYFSSPSATDVAPLNGSTFLPVSAWIDRDRSVSFSKAAAPSTSPGGGFAGRDCKSYTIVAARGTGENQTDPNGGRNLLARVMQAVPNGEAYEVVYPATFNFLSDPEKGAEDLSKHVAEIKAHCPNQSLVIFGYSQGAMVAVNALNMPTMKVEKQTIRAIVFFGDPYYRSNLPQNRGTAESGTGLGIFKAIVNWDNTLPEDLAPVTRDFCNKGDVVCQGPLSVGGFSIMQNLAVGDVPAHHYSGTPQEEEAIRFTLSQLQGVK